MKSTGVISYQLDYGNFLCKSSQGICVLWNIALPFNASHHIVPMFGVHVKSGEGCKQSGCLDHLPIK